MKINILHVIHSLQVGGLENGVVNLINSLTAETFRHSICCIDSAGSMAERIHQDVSIYSLGKGQGSDYLMSLKIARLIKKIDPDIVHTRNWSAIDGILGARLAGKRKIIHGEHGREANDPEGKNGRRRIMRKVLSPWVSRFVAVSEELRDWLINDIGVNPEKVTQIINGVDTDSIRPMEMKDQFKSELGIPSGAFVVGSVGRLDPVKDHETLIRSFKIVAEKNKKSELVLLLVGDGPVNSHLKEVVKNLNMAENVIFTGERDDVKDLYNCMDIYVLPSIAEGISNTVLEAMASGLPVIASSVGGNLELVHQERTGFFFTPGNVEELTVLIEQYLHNGSLASHHGHNGRERAVNIFSIHQMTDKYAALYESCCHSA